MAVEMTRDQAADEIDPAAGRRAHHHAHGLAPVEGRNIVLGAHR
jgi:hypothetical protein